MTSTKQLPLPHLKTFSTKHLITQYMIATAITQYCMSVATNVVYCTEGNLLYTRNRHSMNAMRQLINNDSLKQ